ncbi:Protein UBASH3A-like protein [Diplonema papillatum]|nr:Protein UBASH3A-like protein [Diplonema papillatum]|eukprot:gene12196-18844_t
MAPALARRLFGARQIHSGPKIKKNPAHMALLIARHGEREDYVDTEGFYKSDWGVERPWDPKLTEEGKWQARELGKRVKLEVERRGLKPVTKVLTSPLVRCVQTAVEANKALGVEELCVEEGVVEALCENWFRTWSVPGANAQWGGPPTCRMGVAVPEADLHPLAVDGPVSVWIPTLDQLKGWFPGVKFSGTYSSVLPMREKPYKWARPEHLESEAPKRCTEAGSSVHQRFPDETVLVLTHGGPTQFTYCGLTGDPVEPPLSFTSLTMLIPRKNDTDGSIKWEAPIVGCCKHISREKADSA